MTGAKVRRVLGSLASLHVTIQLVRYYLIVLRVREQFRRQRQC